MTDTSKIRVVLADDHAVLRAGLRALINSEPDMEVVGEAANGREVVDLAERLRPDVIVMDIGMPDMNGLDATRAITSKGLPSRVLVLTMHTEEQYLFQVLQAGGSGYVLKRSADTELMDAIRTVHRGEAFLYPGATRLLLEEYLRSTGPEGTDTARKRLTEREREVLTLTAAGYTNQEIAERLYISPKTVDTYRQRIMEKLDLHHRSELVRYALEKGLLTSETA
ncbi:MAG TPA: response regulator transcription factor [Dehalococcoidia bacterium]